MSERRWVSDDGPWHHAQRRRVRRHWLGLVIGGVIGVLFIALLGGALLYFVGQLRAVDPASERMLGGVVWIMLGSVGVPVLIGMAALVPTIRRYRIERSILRLVPAHDGLLCPRCRVPLDGAGAEKTCPRCKQEIAAGDAQTFWADYPAQARVHLHQRAAPVVSGRTSLPGSGVPRPVLAIIRRPHVALGVTLLAWIVLMGVYTAVFGGTLLGNLMSQWWVIAFVAVMLVMTKLLRSKDTGRRFCAGCGYAQDQERPSALCPECSAAWLEPGGTTTHAPDEVKRARWLAVVPAMLILIFMVGPAVLKSSGVALDSATPTWILLGRAGSAQGLDTGEWIEIGRRALTAEQEHTLFERLLDQRRRRNHLSADAQAWVGALLARGAMPPDLVDRYYAEMLDATLAGPDRAKAGEPVQLELRFTFREFSPRRVIVLYVEGPRVDDGVIALGDRAGEPFSPWSLEAGDDFNDRRLPLRPISIDTPGRHVVSFTFWQVLGPSALMQQPIIWKDDGTPVLDPTVIDTRRVECERTVIVEP